MDKKTNKPTKERLQDEGTGTQMNTKETQMCLTAYALKNKTKQRGEIPKNENTKTNAHRRACSSQISRRTVQSTLKGSPPFSQKEKVVLSKQLDLKVLLFEQGGLGTKKEVASKQLDFNVLLFEQGDLRTKEEEVSKQLDFNVLLTKSVSK